MMSTLLRTLLIVASASFLAYVLRMIRRDRFLLRYSFAWVVLGLLGVLAALYPNLVVMVSSTLGFEAPSSFLFLACIFFLMVTSIVFISALSRQARMIERLVQEVSLMKMQESNNKECTSLRG